MRRRTRQGFAYLLIMTILFMSVPAPMQASTGDSAPIVIDNIVDSIADTAVISIVGLSEGNTGILYSTTDNNWTTKVRYKVLNTAGVLLSDTNISSLMGARATNVYSLAAYAIADGKAVITWEGTSNGCGGAFQFVIVDDNGTVVKGATDISTASSTYNCYTGVTELSNGNIAFMWQNTGDEYLYRIFDASGNAVTNPASVEKGGTRQDNFGHNSTYIHSLSANDQGQFLITYDIYQNSNYIGAMYDNDGTRRLTNSVHHFYLDSKPSSETSYNIGLPGGKFGVFYRTNSTLSMDIINNQGAVQTSISSDLNYDDHVGGALAVKGGGFLVYDTSTVGDSSYLHTKHYSADGTLLKDWTQRDTNPVIDLSRNLYYSMSPFIFSGYDSGFGFYNTVTNKLYLYDVGSSSTPSTPVAIVGQPTNITVNEGGTAGFAVLATDATSYQWQVDTGSGYGNITDSAVYSGATTDTLLIIGSPLSMSGYMYRVIVNGSASSTATSSGASLTVNPSVHAEKPSIGTQPANQTVYVNGTAPLSVTATISDSGSLSYQWYSNTTNSNSGGTLIGSANSASYSPPTGATGVTYYYVVVTNTNASASGTKTATAVSNAISVTVKAPTTFTVSPASNVTFATLKEGYNNNDTNALNETITLTKVGTEAITNLAVSLSGGVSTKFSIGSVNGNSLGAGILSTSFIIHPKTGLARGTYTETVTIIADGGLSASFQVSFTVDPSTFTVSETGTVTFDSLIQGYTTTQVNGIKKNITLTKVGNGIIDNLAVNFSGGATSRFMTGTVPSDTLGAGVNSAVFKVFPKAGLAPGTYTETVTITAAGNISHSFQVSFTVIPLVHAAVPVIGTQPASEAVDKGADLTLSVGATISDNGTLNYQWFSNTTNSINGGTPIVDANSATYEVPTNTAGTFYYYVGLVNRNNDVNGTKFASAFSNVAEVTVLQHAVAPSITSQPADEVVNVGDNESLSVGATSNDGGTLSYQWYSNTVDSTIGGTLIDGATSATYAIPTNSTGIFYYYVVVTNTNNGVNGTKTASATSSVSEVAVNHTYEIEAISDLTASVLTQGYATSQAETVTITNSGTGALANIVVAISGSDAEHFVVTQPEQSLNAGLATSFTIRAKEGLVAATYSITVTISATNMTNESFVVTQVVLLPDPPTEPQQVSTKPGNGQVTIAWKAVDGATYYNVYRVTGEDQYTLIDTVTALEYTVKNLANGTVYGFVVKAGNPGGMSDYSSQVLETPATVPGAPPNVIAFAGSHQARITFTAPADNGGSEITGYEVIASPGNIVTTGSTSPIIVNGLTNGVAYTFTVRAINSAGNSDLSLPTYEVTPRAAVYNKPADENVEVIVNGKVERAGVAKKELIDGKLITTITLDEAQIMERLAEEGEQAVITIPFTSSSEVIIAEVNGRLMKALEDKNTTIVIRTEHATYTILSSEINIQALSAQLGANGNLKDMKILIQIATPSDDTVKNVKDAITANGLLLVAGPLSFKISANYGNASIEINNFNSYVERTIAIPEGIDPTQITTGIVVEEDGSIRHVPTNIENIDGQYIAHINSLTNSVYALIGNQVAYADAATHWASESIHNMGARLIVNGVSEGQFAPNEHITRAEFAAIVVRALGLKLQPSQGKFTDVEQGAWYSSVVQTAYAYGLINGFQDGTFGPQKSITREQAMVIISKAMSLTDLHGVANGSSVESIVGAYKDGSQVASWAVVGVADAISASIVSGKGDHSLAPQAAITRAEVAVIIERLLQNSGLINKVPVK